MNGHNRPTDRQERFTVGSLFSGIGGFDLGFERAGFEIVWQCEADEFCRRALAKHWPSVPCYPDVRKLRVADADGQPQLQPQGLQPDKWRRVGDSCDHARSVDVLIGGFPCQDVSSAGKGAGLAGRRSGLWFQFDRLIGELQPRVVVIENVRGLLVRGVDRVLGCLADRGYDAEWALVRARDVGAPHQRARIFIVAYPEKSRRNGSQCGCEHVADASSRGQRIQRRADRTGNSGHPHGGGSAMADAGNIGCERRARSGREAIAGSEHTGRVNGADASDLADAERDGCGGVHGDAGYRSNERQQRSDAVGRGDGLSNARISGLPLAESEELSGARWRIEGRATPELHCWPARPGEPQYDWEPSRTIPSSRAQSALGGVPDGVSAGLARRSRLAAAAEIQTEAGNVKPGWRRAALSAFGNAVVPQVAEVVAMRVRAILKADSFGPQITEGR